MVAPVCGHRRLFFFPVRTLPMRTAGMGAFCTFRGVRDLRAAHPALAFGPPAATVQGKGVSQTPPKHMSAMKKSNQKSKSPAPATTPAKAKAKPAPARAVKAAKPVPTKTSSIAPEPVPTAAIAAAVNGPANPVAAVAAVAAAPVQTRIVAQADVGYGNALYIRGDGPGLSWHQGVRMECVASDQWELVLGDSPRPISFKVLLNDITWCSGPDSVVASGSTATVTPEFA